MGDKIYKIPLFLYGLVYIGMGVRAFVISLFMMEKVLIRTSHTNLMTFYKLIMAIVGLYAIICGIGILVRKEEARKGVLFITYVGAFASLIIAIRGLSKFTFGVIPNPIFIANLYLFVIFPIYFFTRPKVKEQFR